MKNNEQLPTPATDSAAVVERNELALQIGSTMIPDLGMTFIEAAERVRELVYESDNGPSDPDGKRGDELWAEYSPIEDAILTSQPRTVADIVAQLDMLLHPSIGLTSSDINKNDVQALRAMRDHLLMMVHASWKADTRPNGLVERLLDSTVLPGSSLTFATAREQVRRLELEQSAIKGGDEENGRRDEIFAKWGPLWDAVLTSTPKTLRDALAILDLLACPNLGMRSGSGSCHAEAVERVRSLIAEILADASEVVPFEAPFAVALPDGSKRREVADWAKGLRQPVADLAALVSALPGTAATGSFHAIQLLTSSAQGSLSEIATNLGFIEKTLGVAHPPAVEQQRTAWEDTIAAFEAAAEMVLSLPVPPTAAILKAGAQTLGITEEQFGHAYAAAAEAHLKEIAA